MAALDIRVGDVVRLLDLKVTEVGTHTISGDYVGGSQGYTYPSRYVAEIISRAETDAEKIARLEAELAKAPRRIEWGGGECPIKPSDCVAIWKRNGGYTCGQAAMFEWVHFKSEDYQGLSDIIAYMVLPS